MLSILNNYKAVYRMTEESYHIKLNKQTNHTLYYECVSLSQIIALSAKQYPSKLLQIYRNTRRIDTISMHNRTCEKVCTSEWSSKCPV